MARSLLVLFSVLCAALGVAHAEPISFSFTVFSTTVTVSASAAAVTAAVAAATVAASYLVATSIVPDIGNQGTSIPARGAKQPYRHIAGRTSTAGVDVAYKSTQTGDSEGNRQWLLETRVLSCTPISAIVGIEYDGSLIYPSGGSASFPANGVFDPTQADGVKLIYDAGGNVRTELLANGRDEFAPHITTNLGQAGEPIDAMGKKWGDLDATTGTHQPFAYAQLRRNFDESSGRRTPIRFIIEGATVYDPRDVNQDPADRSTWEYSDNVALICAWYVMQPDRYAIPHTRIDWDSVAAAANICDELVTIPDSEGRKPGDGGYVTTTEKRYRCGLTYLESDDRASVLQQLVQSMAGWFIQPRVTGKWQFFAGSYTAPTGTILAGDIIKCDSYSPKSNGLKNRHDLVRGRYQAQAANHTVTAYPQVTITSDALTNNELSLDLDYVYSPYQAQRIAQIQGRRSHYSARWEGRLKVVGLAFAAGENVFLNDPTYNLVNRVMRVESSSIEAGPDGLEVRAVLVEENSAIYAYDVADMTVPAEYTIPGVGVPGDPTASLSIDPTDFTDLTDQALDTQVTSNSVTISGQPGTSYILAVSAIAGMPELQVNSGGWRTAAVAEDGDTLQLRMTTSASNSATHTAFLTGTPSGLAVDWAITTVAA